MRQKTLFALGAMRSELLAGTSQAGVAGVLINLMAGAIDARPVSSLLLDLIGDTRLTRWLKHIRRTLQISQVAIELFRALSGPKKAGSHSAIVRERTDGPDSGD